MPVDLQISVIGACAVALCCPLAGCEQSSDSLPRSIGDQKYEQSTGEYLKYEVYYDTVQRRPFAVLAVAWGGRFRGKPLQEDINQWTLDDSGRSRPVLMVGGESVDPVKGRVVVLVNNTDGRLMRTSVPVEKFVKGVLDERGRPVTSRVARWVKETQQDEMQPFNSSDPKGREPDR